MVTSAPLENTALPAPAQQVQELMNGYRNTALVYVAAKLGIADLLAAGPCTSDALAAAANAHPAALRRILRHLVLLNILTEEADGAFGLTPLGACLQSDVPGSQRGWAILAGEEFAPASCTAGTTSTASPSCVRAARPCPTKRDRQLARRCSLSSGSCPIARSRLPRRSVPMCICWR